MGAHSEGRYKATWKREFKLPWREAGPPNHLDDEVDSNQQVVNKEISLFGAERRGAGGGGVSGGAPPLFLITYPSKAQCMLRG